MEKFPSLFRTSSILTMMLDFWNALTETDDEMLKKTENRKKLGVSVLKRTRN